MAASLTKPQSPSHSPEAAGFVALSLVHEETLDEKVSAIAKQVLSKVPESFTIQDAPKLLEVVKTEMESIIPSEEIPQDLIDNAFSYVKDPLKYLSDRKQQLNQETRVSLPRKTHVFVINTLKNNPPVRGHESGLGSGSFGDVTKSELPGVGSFAVKRLKPVTEEGKEKEGLLSLKDKMLKKSYFKNEASILMSLNHRNIISVEAISKGKIFLELADGGNLLQALKSSDLTAGLIQQYILDVVEGLEFIHQNGLTYKDLKVENTLISEGIAKLCDFGFTVPKEKDNHWRGTPSCIAPECFFKKFSQAADIYSLGVLMFNMIAKGHDPYVYKRPGTHEQNHLARAFDTYNKPCDKAAIFARSEKTTNCIKQCDPQGVISDLIVSCLHGDPKKRPPLAEIKRQLQVACLNYELSEQV